jgi:hypothetical protein
VGIPEIAFPVGAAGRWRRRRRSLASLALVALTTACGARFYEPPSGPASPATDGPQVLADATRRCRDVRTFQASMRLSGRRLPNLNVTTGVVTDGRLMLQVGATAAPDLWMAGSADAATLLLREGNRNRVVRAPAAAIVEALVGVSLGPQQFLALLTGCVARDLTATEAVAYNGTRRIATPDATLYVESLEGAWRIVAGSLGDIRVDYRPVAAPFPARVSVRADARDVRFTLEIQEALADRPIADEDLQLTVPPGAVPMTLDELREMFARR